MSGRPYSDEEPRLRSVEILLWLYREHPEQFTIKDIVSEYGITRGEAQRRVNYMLHIWGAVRLTGKLQAHRRGRKEIAYALTRWGNKYAAKAQKRSRRAAPSGGGRAAANPKE